MKDIHKIFIIVASVFFLLSWLSLSAFADQASEIKEAFDFINDKIKNRHTAPKGKCDFPQRLEMTKNPCELKYIGEGGFTTIDFFNLKDFDPQSVKVSGGVVTSYTTGRKKVVKQIFAIYSPEFKKTKFLDHLDMAYGCGVDTDAANRIKRAFTHMIKVCGGKSERW